MLSNGLNEYLNHILWSGRSYKKEPNNQGEMFHPNARSVPINVPQKMLLLGPQTFTSIPQA